MITTNNKRLYEKVLDLKNPAPDNRSQKKIISLNSRMSNVNAALGLAQLEQLENFIKKKRKIVSMYESLLNNISGIELIKEEKNIGITNLTPSYNKLIISFDLNVTNYKKIKVLLENLTISDNIKKKK